VDNDALYPMNEFNGAVAVILWLLLFAQRDPE
jgi:hypothetical protein